MLHFRGTAFVPTDLLAIRTAVDVMGRYTLDLSDDMVFGIVVWAAILLLSLSLTGKRCEKRKVLPSIILRLVCAAIAVAIAVWFCNCDPIQSMGYGFSIKFNAQYYNYWTYGTPAAFFENLKHCVYKEPEGYDAESLLKWEETYTSTDGSNELQPNIIVVMNESFCDYSMWGNEFGLSGEDSAPYFASLCQTLPHGKLLVSTTGGGTCNTEFEAITSNSLYFMPANSYPYQQYVRDNITSVIKYANELGYTTVGMHPAVGTNWNRSVVYPMLGFDETVFIDGFPDDVELCRNLVSDHADYERLLRLIDDEEEPLFVYNVTIQNHSSYIEGADEQLVELSNKDEFPLANNYVNLIRISDRELEYLLDELEQIEEPTVVLFFGDHQAGAIESEFEDLAFGFDSDNPQNAYELQQQYIVHFFMWSNCYDWKNEDYGVVSANYLLPLLFDRLQLPLSGYYQYLLELREKIVALNCCGIITESGDYYLEADEIPDEYRALLKQYEMVQYQSLFDSDENNSFFNVVTAKETE